MIKEDRELLAELKHVTTHVTDFLIATLGATPVNPDSQRELADHLLTTGQLLLDHTNAGHIINGYINGCVTPTAGALPRRPRGQAGGYGVDQRTGRTGC
ncbi:hypothetical protein [Umezawaea sp. NPDC059074]|uniref:hypothetical protein n=1 Tax=Umezawaea sp. NPDC059074 TaxID=3346716 RepID=UPI0036AB5D4F